MGAYTVVPVARPGLAWLVAGAVVNNDAISSWSEAAGWLPSELEGEVDETNGLLLLILGSYRHEILSSNGEI